MTCNDLEEEARKLAQDVIAEKKSHEKAKNLSDWKVSMKVKENVKKLQNQCDYSATMIGMLYSEPMFDKEGNPVFGVDGTQFLRCVLSLPLIYAIIREGK